MSRTGLGLLIVLVLATNAFVLVGVARNRSGEPEARIELTERELSLPFEWEERAGSESTGIALRLRWNLSSKDDYLVGPDWFDERKLEELGFDCSIPVTSPQAAERYGRMLSRETYAVLELDGDAWKEWLAWREAGIDERERKVESREETQNNLDADRARLERSRRIMSRLFLIDVGNDPVALRAKYPDKGRFIIAPALAGLVFFPWTHDHENPHAPAKPAEMRGSVERILVSEIHVPRSMRRFLDELLAAQKAERQRNIGVTSYVPKDREPQYAVTLQYGRRYEPWVVEVRPLGPDP